LEIDVHKANLNQSTQAPRREQNPQSTNKIHIVPLNVELDELYPIAKTNYYTLAIQQLAIYKQG
jgi:hypothetical protein